MATLTVWKFSTPDGADAAADTLVDLQRQDLIVIHDAATVSWPGDAKRPKTLSSDAVTDRVKAAFAGQTPELIESNLSGDEEAKLREVFAE